MSLYRVRQNSAPLNINFCQYVRNRSKHGTERLKACQTQNSVKINVLLLILRHSTASLDSFRKSYNCNVWNHNFVESIKTRSLDGQDQNQGLEDVPDQGHVLEDSKMFQTKDMSSRTRRCSRPRTRTCPRGLEDVPDQGHVLEDMHQDSNKVKIGK